MKKVLICLLLLTTVITNIALVNAADDSSDLVRYEAEDAEITNCKLKGKMEGSVADYGSYSGDGFVGEIDYDTSKIEFTVNVSEEGEYKFYVSYAIGSEDQFGPGTFNLFINNKYFSSISCTVRNGWGVFAETPNVDTTISLHKGESKLAFTKGYGHVELDYIEIGQRVGDYKEGGSLNNELSQVPSGYTRYELEEGKVSNGKIYETGGSFSGKGYVGELDWSGMSKVELTVTAPEDGEYSIRLAYAIGYGFKPATFKIFNTKGLYTSLSCDKIFGWGNFDVQAISEGTVSLRAGENLVAVYKSSEYAQVDFIDIGNVKIGEYKDMAIVTEQPNLLEGYTRYEAEEQLIILGVAKGIKYFVDFGTYSGYGYVGQLDSDDCYIEIPITVAEDGEYSLRICYASFESGASFKIYSGRHGRGGNAYFYKEEFTEVALGWGEFSSDTIVETSVCLKAGTNYILIRSGLIRCEIDYIDFGAKIGDYYEGVLDESLNRNNK